MPQSISPAEVAAIIADGTETLIVDVRSPVEWHAVHVDGAVHVPLNTLDPAQVMAELPENPERQVFVICHAGPRSMDAAKKFEAAGIDSVRYIEGGTKAWVASELPAVHGKKAGISIERQLQMTVGVLIVTGSALGFFLNPYFLAIPAFVGLGLLNAGLTGLCPLAAVIAMMPWNNRSGASCPLTPKPNIES